MDKAEYANDFLNIIRSLIKEEQQKQDRTEICQIDSINEDGSLNIKMLSDFDQIRVIPNIQNQSVYEFKSGDFAIIYLIQNQLSNSFIIAKCQPRLSDLRNYSDNGSNKSIQNIAQQSGGAVNSVNGKVGNVIITAEELGAITTLPTVDDESVENQYVISVEQNNGKIKINRKQISYNEILNTPSIPSVANNGKLLDLNNNEIFSADQENNSMIVYIDCGTSTDVMD